MRGLYAIIDPERCGRHDPARLARAVLRGGCAALQLRAKRLSDDEYLILSRELAGLCAEQQVPFFVNDRLAVAVALAGEGLSPGLHLGQHDTPVPQAREHFDGPIGWSTHNRPQVERAQALPVDLIGFGPVFETGSKAEADPVVGTAALAAACALSRVPVVAIGGIDRDRATQVLATGASLLAMLSALAAAPDPQGLARRVHSLAIACGA